MFRFKIQKRSRVSPLFQELSSPREGSLVLVDGQNMSLKIVFHERKRPHVAINENHLELALSNDLSHKQCERQSLASIEKFYRTRTLSRCRAVINELQNQEFKSVGALRIKSMRTRWGSCSIKNNLNFSKHLCKLPTALQDYVIVHEYAHLFEMNHSQAFWRKVETFMPDYLARRKALRAFEKSFITPHPQLFARHTLY